MASEAGYLTAQELIDWLGWMDGPDKFTPTASTTPNTTAIEDAITSAEEEIEKRTRRNWRGSGNYLSKTERHSWDWRRQRAYRTRSHHYIQIELGYQKVQAVTAIKTWQSDSWYDLVASGTEGNSVGHQDYYIDYEYGTVYIHTNYPSQGRNNIEIVYTYGEAADDLPGDVKRAVKMLTGIEAMNNWGSLFQFTIEDTQAGNRGGMLQAWLDRVDVTCERRALLKAFNLQS